jgi:hypothetical protein
MNPSQKINIGKLTETLSGNRNDLIKNLERHGWYKSTSKEIRTQLVNLPSDFDGFLKDLGDRPDTLGNVDILKLTKIAFGNYLIIPIFEVRSVLTNEIFTHEFVSWKYGKHSGYHGVILVEIKGKIEYLLVRKTVKFPIGAPILDSLGIFLPSFSQNRPVDISKTIEQKIAKLLSLKNLNFIEFIELGSAYSDDGMSNNLNSLFASVIGLNDISELDKYTKVKSFNTTTTGFTFERVAIDKILDFSLQSQDAILHTCIGRLIALKYI